VKDRIRKSNDELVSALINSHVCLERFHATIIEEACKRADLYGQYSPSSPNQVNLESLFERIGFERVSQTLERTIQLEDGRLVFYSRDQEEAVQSIAA
jgi:hypothetical protein